MKKLLAALAFLLAPVIAQADLINGGFETGDFTGWSTAGDTLVVDASLLGIPPPAGNFQALITNAPALFIPGGHAESYSGVPSIGAYSGVPSLTSPLEAFLGLPAHSLANLGQTLPLVANGTPIEGSEIWLSFSASAGGDILSFRWNYSTSDCCGSPSDFAFAVLDGNLFLLASAASPFLASNTPFFLSESGYQFFATTLTPGAHYIGIGVVDTWDSTVNSAVLVDNFSVTKVPEPASLLLLGLGLIGVARVGCKITRYASRSC
jgi:hypothetical protein